MEFVESFMKFSFDDDNIFRIEEDELIRSVEGRKACECVVLISENVALIEAKASAPRISNTKKIDEFLDEIRQKFKDSLQLFTEMKTKTLGEESFQRLPVNLRHAPDEKANYKIYLIVHGHELEWLLGLLDALKDTLRDVVKKWNMRDSNVKVFNEQTALENNLIVAYIPKADLPSVKQPNGNADPEKVSQWFVEHAFSTKI